MLQYWREISARKTRKLAEEDDGSACGIKDLEVFARGDGVPLCKAL